jgi:hypothetical protein
MTDADAYGVLEAIKEVVAGARTAVAGGVR